MAGRSSFGAVQRRKRGNCHAGYQKEEGGSRHAMNEPAELVDIARMYAGQNGAGPKKQEALEKRVIERVEQGSR